MPHRHPGSRPGPESRFDAAGTAQRYAVALLRSLGHAPASSAADPPTAGHLALHPALLAAHCGLPALTGEADGAAQICPAPLAAAAEGALAALARLAPPGAFAQWRAANLLTERAALLDHRRAGRSSPGGSCRLLATADGAIAVNLAREDDWSLLPAWLEQEIEPDWDALGTALSARTMHDAVERARLLGLAAAPLVPPPSRPPPWLRVSLQPEPAPASPAAARRGYRRARVLDLSSLWAGPLCSQLLQACGADVVKLESRRRPDGARVGPAAFFDLLNAGKRSVALDFSDAHDRVRLRELILAADIVIEASRPRALRQLGIDAEDCLRRRPQLTWVSLTGYGRDEPQAQWIAYGDDAGVAAGLSWIMKQVAGTPVFVGDAIADPLTGLHAALAAWDGWCRGGGGLRALSLVDVLRHLIAFESPGDADGWRQRARQWRAQSLPGTLDALPAPRHAHGRGPELGADGEEVFSDWLSDRSPAGIAAC